MDEYRSSSFLYGHIVDVFPLAGVNKTPSYKAKVLDITDDAGLVVELENGERRILNSGEVSIRNW